MPGPLEGLRIIEVGGIGPGPFCGMMLADHGAEVIRVDRPGVVLDPKDPLSRSRRSIVVDMKRPEGVAVVRDLVKGSDGLVEGYRPGVMERLGLGPDLLLKDNPSLVYGRMTGWGQTGPYAAVAGHDINYIALSGVLHSVGVSGGRPVPPVNYLGDFGGGGMMLAFAMVASLVAVRGGGPGEVVDCAMTDGSALLSSMTWHGMALGSWRDEPGVNLLDGGAPFYDTYECSDGRYVAFGSIEPQFYSLFRTYLGVADDPDFDDHMNSTRWPQLKAKVASIIRTRSRAEWCALMEGTDACFTPVLSLREAVAHPHNVERGTFIEVDGHTQPAPAPRYSRRSLSQPIAAGCAGQDTTALLSRLTYSDDRIAQLRATGVIE